MTYYQIETGASPDQGFRARQQARAARRAMLAEKRAKREMVIDRIKFAGEVIVGAAILYVWLFLAAL